MIKLNALRLSSNPSAKKDSTGNFNITSDGRLYLIGEFENPNDPFGGVTTRMIGQQLTTNPDGSKTPTWKVNLANIRASIGKPVEGNIVSAECEPYELNGRIVNRYTAVVFARESAEQIFKSAGHPMITPIEQPALQPVEDLA